MFKVIVFIAFIIPSTISAQSIVRVYIFGGGSLPNYPSEYSNYYNLGFNGGLGFLHDISETTDLQVEGMYNYNSFNSKQLIDDLNLEPTDFRSSSDGFIISSLTAGINYKILESRSTLLLGTGYYFITSGEYKLSNIKENTSITSNSRSSNNLGFYFGLLYDLNTINVKLKYHSITGNPEATNFYEFGLLFYVN